MQAGDLDLGFMALFPDVDIDGLESMAVWEEPLTLAVTPSHPITRLGSVTLADVAALPLIVTRHGTAQRLWFDRVLAQTGGQAEIVLETNEVAAAVAYASIGIGATLFTRRVIEGIGQPVGIVPILDSPIVRMVMAWRQGAT